MKKRLGLVVLEVKASSAWALRVVLFLIFALSAHYLYEMIADGSFFHRGELYTLTDNPARYLSRAFKYGVFIAFSAWYMTLGTEVKSQS